MLKSKKQLIDALKGNYPLIYIVSEDERPVIETIRRFIEDTGEEFDLYSWDYQTKANNLISGKYLTVPNGDEKEGNKTKRIDYQDCLMRLKNMQGNRIQLFCDFHERLDGGTITDRTLFLRTAKNITYDNVFPFTKEYSLPIYEYEEGYRKFLIFVSPVLYVPKELESLMHIIHFENPDLEEMKKLLKSFVQEKELNVDDSIISEISKNLVGLTETEAMLAIRKSYLLQNKEKVSLEDVKKEKKQVVHKKGTLEFLDANVNRDEIGGFENLFSWLERRKLLFNEGYKEKYNLSYPKGVILTGVPGCGKSLAAKVMADEFNIPLIRMDFGSLLGKFLGESDTKMRNALAVVEKMAPCVLWVDEIEKSLNSNENTHETTKRMFGYFLTWMQETEHPVFICATANNIDAIPPEFTRKGRFDEIWFVDLPTHQERKKIFEIHWKNRNITLRGELFESSAELTKGFSGAEIEAIVKETVITSIYENREIDIELITSEIRKVTPLSVTNKEKITAIQRWAEENQVRSVSFEKNSSKVGKIGFR